LSAIEVEVLPTDISAYRRGNTGVDYVHRFESGRPGPTTMVLALTHGNEICGAHAVKLLLERCVRPRRGALVLGFVNVAAYQRFDAGIPTASRFVDEDFNRLWDAEVLDGPRQSAELGRARALRPLVAAADYLLDIHSMQSRSPALMLSGLADKGRALARKVGVPGYVVADAGHRAGRRMRDYGAFAEPESGKTALLVECGQHWLRPTVEVAIETAFRFLIATGCILPEAAGTEFAAAPPPQRVIEVSGPVTIESSEFRFVAEYQGMELIPAAGTVIGYDGERAVATPHDDCVLIMPSRRLQRGQTAVRFGRVVG
jgi:predicted deacylase